ncbi:hypothetical protein [Mammaliicoccus sciuri]|uniref:hypothetical protein n=1 Tax=Mammaliicoccus sciuri TaxID=1296 RepID=UPI000D1F11E3|nr:hypothetical protein [Mammaliicoccus sciuri]MBV5103459.1 hypothetical protein [Mammaliicoccus sciuri]PTK16706.1 hypothetical protein BUZ90_02625 [Mammaliicoccus sciuri]
MEKDNYYVPRHEWERSRGKLNQRINEVDQKHTNLNHRLANKIELQTQLQQQTLDKQSETNEHLKNLTVTMSGFGERVVELEYQTKSNVEDIKEVKETIKERKKGNVEIYVALIGGITTIVAAAFGLAQLL